MRNPSFLNFVSFLRQLIHAPWQRQASSSEPMDSKRMVRAHAGHQAGKREVEEQLGVPYHVFEDAVFDVVCEHFPELLLPTGKATAVLRGSSEARSLQAESPVQVRYIWSERQPFLRTLFHSLRGKGLQPAGVEIPLMAFCPWSLDLPVSAPLGESERRLIYQEPQLGIEVQVHDVKDCMEVRVLDLKRRRAQHTRISLLRGSSLVESSITSKEHGWVRFKLAQPLEATTATALRVERL